MKFSSKDFFSKCDQIRRKLRIWSHLLKKSLMEILIFSQCVELFWNFSLWFLSVKKQLLSSLISSRFKTSLFFRISFSFFCLFYLWFLYVFLYFEVIAFRNNMWCVVRFWISHCLAFAWSLERMRMHANALFYLHIVLIRLYELAWHSNGSIKCQTFECHSNG